MQKLYTGRDSMEAHFVCSLLEAEGIRASVLGEILGMARGDLPLTQETLPSVWVNVEDLDRAATVLARVLKHSPPEPPVPTTLESWTCPACCEVIEGQFAVCWNCQTPRPNGDSRNADDSTTS